MLNNVHRHNGVNFFVAFSAADDNQVNADGIVEALFVNNVLNREVITAYQSAVLEIFAAFATYNANVVPALSYALLPCCDALSQLIVIGGECLVTCSFGVVEAIIIVV